MATATVAVLGFCFAAAIVWVALGMFAKLAGAIMGIADLLHEAVGAFRHGLAGK